MATFRITERRKIFPEPNSTEKNEDQVKAVFKKKSCIKGRIASGIKDTDKRHFSFIYPKQHIDAQYKAQETE